MVSFIMTNFLTVVQNIQETNKTTEDSFSNMDWLKSENL